MDLNWLFGYIGSFLKHMLDFFKNAVAKMQGTWQEFTSTTAQAE